MTDTVGRPKRWWPIKIALIVGALGGLPSLALIAVWSAIQLGRVVDVLPVQARPQQASVAQVEAVGQVTLPPGTVLLSAAYSNGLETMLSAKFRLPRVELDAFLATAHFDGQWTPGLRTITAAHNVGGGNLWDPESAVTVAGLREQRSGQGTRRTVMLDLDSVSAITVYLHAHRG